MGYLIQKKKKSKSSDDTFKKKWCFIKSIGLMKWIAFLKWKLLLGFAGIMAWLEHINTISGTGAKFSGCHNLFLCGLIGYVSCTP